MKILLIASPSGDAGLTNLLSDAGASSALPEGVEQICHTTWLLDERKALSFYAAFVHNAPSRKVSLAVFRVDDDARLL
ncbi:MAG: hypothetical protein H0V62_05780 [Gammaproteobacteria bacterium]|nr:hypothetical protein [Gammaproteobacteria bacterium]MBA3731972.1 hypothetical protein [Gammaproteobacteria bacterium]